MEALIRDALKDFDTFKELTETIPLEVLSAEAEALSKSHQQIFQEYTERLAVHQLADRVRQCFSWAEVSEALASDPMHKNEAWALLSEAQKERIKNLLAAAAKPLDPNGSSLVGKRVYVTPGDYRKEGEGVAEVDRGYGSLRVVEVRMPSGKIQSVQLGELRLAT
jgi:hypothetical protein